MMESLSPLKRSLDPQIIRDIAVETGIDAAFVEKDWHAVQLLSLLSSFKNDRDVTLIFSGGTSLSKGHAIIKRFSEDLDFILNASLELSKEQRKSFRQDVISHILLDGRFQVADADVKRGDNHRFFKAPLVYAMAFPGASLRPYLQLEMTFARNRLPPITCPIRSIVAEVSGLEPEAHILCVSPIETAADKLSALTWRVLVRDRQAEGDDPTIIRHLHDLAALQTQIGDNRDVFVDCARQSIEQDRVRRRGGERITSISTQDRLEQAIQALQTDTLYRAEYEQFVLNMSYADEGQVIGFDQALLILKKIILLALAT
jgi:predicted nucleotidyltransferase component of viral defense system